MQLTIKTVHSTKNIKYILLYNDMLDIELCLDGGFATCPVNTCESTNNSYLMPIEDFDAIIFHEPTLSVETQLPIRRSSNQIYIYFSIESPITSPVIISSNFYNWTMTYRRDSDLYFPYGSFSKSRSNFTELNLTQFNKKTKLIAWFVTNCWSDGAIYRKKYVEEIQKYIPVDIYGPCGNLSCPGRRSLQCYHMLDDNYKFYLSFENSLCQDYITEKLYNILNYTNVVPVVFGFADYKSLAPAGSYINAEDFKSVKELTDYIYEVGSDFTKYKQYFKWKEEYEVSVDVQEQFCCQLCKKLHEPLRHSWYKNLHRWSIGENNSICHLPEVEFIHRKKTS